MYDYSICDFSISVLFLQSDIQRLQQQQQQRRPSVQQDGAQQAEINALRKQVEEKQKKIDEMDKIMKKCQEKLKVLESQPPPVCVIF